MYPWMNQQNAMASGFDHAATQTAISGIQSSITSGFGDMQTALTGGFAGVQNALHISAITEFGRKVFPFFDLGLGWVVPALIGLVIGLVLTFAMRGKDKKAAA